MQTTEPRLQRPRKPNVGMRISRPDLREIDQLAKRHGLTRTAYMVGAALGRLEDPAQLNQRLQAITDRLNRLEQATYGE